MFSKSCKYAIRAVLYLAIHTNEENKTGVEKLAAELSAPKPFLAIILKKLTKNKIISSTRGRNGGFYLTQENKSKNLLAVIESFDGNRVFTDCVLGLDNCSSNNPCPYHNAIEKYRQAFLKQIRNESIEESAKRINDLDLKLKN